MALEQYLADRDEAVHGAAQAALEQRSSPPVEDVAVPPEVTRPDAAEAEGTAIGMPEPQPPEPEPEPAPASDEQSAPGPRSEDHVPAAAVLVAAWARWHALRAGSRAFGATALVMALALGGVGDVTSGWDAHWCPVGQQVVYEDHDREGTSQLYVIDLTASDPSPVQLTTAGGSDPAW